MATRTAAPVASTVAAQQEQGPTSAPSLTALLGGLIEAQPAARGSKPTSLGLSATALLRYLGAQGVRSKLATAILGKVCPHPISPNTVQAQLASGRKGSEGAHGKVPTLSAAQQQQLATAIAPLVG